MNDKVLRKGVDFTGVTVCMFCHDGAGSVCLNKRSTNCRDEHGRWDICGGSVDFGDTVENTIQKELSEEYNAKPLEIEFLGFRDVHRTDEQGKKTHWIGLDFKIRIDPKSVKNGEPHKFEDIQWFPIKNLPSPLHSQLSNFLKRYKDQLV